jgi:hypothetical protein
MYVMSSSAADELALFRQMYDRDASFRTGLVWHESWHI